MYVCEIHNEMFNESWLQEVEASSAFPPPGSGSSAAWDRSGDRPKQVRDALVTYFSTLCYVPLTVQYYTMSCLAVMYDWIYYSIL